MCLEAVGELPVYIVECVLTIVFSLISHPQLSIRDTVTKIMSAYMEHVDSQVSELSLTLMSQPVEVIFFIAREKTNAYTHACTMHAYTCMHIFIHAHAHRQTHTHTQTFRNNNHKK